jgi:hypothetical protein
MYPPTPLMFRAQKVVHTYIWWHSSEHKGGRGVPDGLWPVAVREKHISGNHFGQWLEKNFRVRDSRAQVREREKGEEKGGKEGGGGEVRERKKRRRKFLFFFFASITTSKPQAPPWPPWWGFAPYKSLPACSALPSTPRSAGVSRVRRPRLLPTQFAGCRPRTSYVRLEDRWSHLQVLPDLQARAPDIRAASVAAEYESLAYGVDLAYNGVPRDRDGDVLALLRSLPPATALAVGALGEWSRRVDQFIADLGVKGSTNPARFGCCHGADQARGVISQHAAKCLGRVALRSVARVRHGALKAVTAGNSSRAGLPWRCCCGL